MIIFTPKISECLFITTVASEYKVVLYSYLKQHGQLQTNTSIAEIKVILCNFNSICGMRCFLLDFRSGTYK